MKKIWGWIVGVVLVVALGIYIIFASSNSGSTQTAANTPTDNSGAGGGTTPSSSDAAAPGSGNSGGTVAAPGQYKDGTYTGPVSNAIYGNLQVVVTISGGKITNVTWPVYPDTAGHTIQVNQAALPTLEQEAIATQVASVNIVSGATQTSEAFQESLGAALSQAKS